MFSHLSNNATLACAVVAISLSLGAASTFAAPMAGTQVIAITGDPLPGDPAVTFDTFNAPSLNDLGQVSFKSSNSNQVTLDATGLYRGAATPGSLIEIVRGNDPAPGGTFYRSFTTPPSINDLGQVGFTSSGNQSSVNGIFLSDATGTSLTTVMRNGDAAPGGGTLSIQPQLVSPAINNSGRAAFRATLSGTAGGSSDDAGIYRFDGAALPLVEIVRKGEPAPNNIGTLTGTIGSSGVFDHPILNEAGQVAFTAAIDGTPGDDSGIFRGNGTTLTRIARRGNAAPGGGTFDSFGFELPALNNGGQAAFFADLETGVVGVEPHGIYRGDGVLTVEIAREGQTIPGGGQSFHNLAPTVVINDSGQVAFESALSTQASNATPGSGGLFRGDGNTLTQIAILGTPAPEGGALSFFADSFAMNEAGQLAFEADIDPDAVLAANDVDDVHALFFFDDVLGLIEIARLGDSFLGSTLESLEFSGRFFGAANGPDGNAPEERTGLNNPGQVAFAFRLADDREGIALWSVPEPGTGVLALLGLGGLVMLGRRSRREGVKGS